ncbi:MAG TPA: MFS transporter [Verrucomicrobiae bacterium]|nr:MFS transporter [Verrucomicrobiae bacterium]
MSRWRGFNPYSSLQGLPREAWVLCGAVLVNRMGTMVIPFLILYLTHDLGQSPSRAALAMAVYGLGAVATAPFAGRLADRIGPRRIVTTSLLSAGLLLLPYPWLRSYPAILALTFIWSVAGEALRPATLSWISGVVKPSQRRAAFALNRLAVNLGMSIGPAVAGFIVERSFAAIFFLDALTSILSGVIVLFATKELLPTASGASARRAAGALPGTPDDPAGGANLSVSAGTDSATSPSPGAGAKGKRAMRDRSFLYFLLGCLPVQIVFFQHASTLPLYLVRDLGLTESMYGMMFTINTLLIITLEVPLNGATSAWSHRRTLALGALLTGLGFGGVGLVHSAAGVALMVVVWTFGEMVLLPGSAAFAADIAPSERRGEYLGLYSMSFSGAFAIAPWLGARTMELLSPRALWAAAALCGVLSALLLSRVRPARHSAPAV